MRIIVDLTGPDHEPTKATKWYAQADVIAKFGQPF